MIIVLKMLARLFAALSSQSAAAAGRWLGSVIHVFLRGKVTIARKALAESFPEWEAARVREVARKVFINQGIFFVEFMRMIGRPKSDPVDEIIAGPALIERARKLRDEHGSLLVLVAHINNYEYLAAWAARLFPLSIITKPLKPARFNDYIRSVRASYGLQEFDHHGSYRQVLRNLKSGGCVGFILDQNRTHKLGVFVTFFGRPASTSPGLAMMSAQSGVPVLPACTVRENGRLRVKLMDLIPPPPDREIATLQDFTQRYTSAIEAMIREQPEGWIWMHKRWRTKPKPGDRVTRPDGTDYHV